MSEVLKSYYEAMNAHDVGQALSFLAEHVCVTFPEEARNWTGICSAQAKFSGMFERMPSFHGSYAVVSALDADGTVVVEVQCQFTCPKSSHESSRNMIYHISTSDSKIVKIEHL